MQVSPISNQNFKATVHMDLNVQRACGRSQELCDVINVIRNYVKCDEEARDYLYSGKITKQQKETIFELTGRWID